MCVSLPRCFNCECDLAAHERHGPSLCANRRRCGCPGWLPYPAHWVTYASEAQRAQRPACRYVCRCGRRLADARVAADHLRWPSSGGRARIGPPPAGGAGPE